MASEKDGKYTLEYFYAYKKLKDIIDEQDYNLIVNGFTIVLENSNIQVSCDSIEDKKEILGYLKEKLLNHRIEQTNPESVKKSKIYYKEN